MKSESITIIQSRKNHRDLAVPRQRVRSGLCCAQVKPSQELYRHTQLIHLDNANTRCNDLLCKRKYPLQVIDSMHVNSYPFRRHHGGVLKCFWRRVTYTYLVSLLQQQQNSSPECPLKDRIVPFLIGNQFYYATLLFL